VRVDCDAPAGKAEQYGIGATFFIVTPNRDRLVALAALVDAGRLHVERARLAAGKDRHRRARRIAAPMISACTVR
jgi:hypothetical protein